MHSAARYEEHDSSSDRDQPRSYSTSVPAEPGAAAAESVRWETRGLLGRLVRVDPLRVATESSPRRRRLSRS
jgi:hypothetical protein